MESQNSIFNDSGITSLKFSHNQKQMKNFGSKPASQEAFFNHPKT